MAPFQSVTQKSSIVDVQQGYGYTSAQQRVIAFSSDEKLSTTEITQRNLGINLPANSLD